jgi:cob(I)alamin adenosyltransferase
MKKAVVYTRTGDSGSTALVSGTRLRKSQDRIGLYGETDELNSFLGLAISLLDNSFDKVFLHKIQSSLFDLGSNLACENEKRLTFKLPQIEEKFILEIEKEIDKMDAVLPELKSFILPGGSEAASAFHVCRTICRRFERSLVAFRDSSPNEVTEIDLKFINRLSDYLFILARFVNLKLKQNEIFWIANKN